MDRKVSQMGKTYREEKQYRKSRMNRDEASHGKRVDHDHERTVARKKLHDVQTHWDDEDFLDEAEF